MDFRNKKLILEIKQEIETALNTLINNVFLFLKIFECEYSHLYHHHNKQKRGENFSPLIQPNSRFSNYLLSVIPNSFHEA
jgi:hypothetical protein